MFHAASLLIVLAFVALGWLPGVARAAESYDNCTGFIDSLPATITSQGTWCLRKHLSTGMVSGAAISIGANNVTLDCNGFKIGGLAGGTGTNAYGVHIGSPELNAAVRRCNIRGFQRGIAFFAGSGHVVERNILDGNTYIGIYVAAPSSTVHGNRVLDTGGSASAAYGVVVSFGVDVIDNTVDGVAAGGQDMPVYGIRTNLNTDALVAGNRVRNLAASGEGAIFGIHNSAAVRTIVRNNDVYGGGGYGVGIHCQDAKGLARDNVVSGFSVASISTCSPYGNSVNAD